MVLESWKDYLPMIIWPGIPLLYIIYYNVANFICDNYIRSMNDGKFN